jgi:hypothetical protein
MMILAVTPSLPHEAPTSGFNLPDRLAYLHCWHYRLTVRLRPRPPIGSITPWVLPPFDDPVSAFRGRQRGLVAIVDDRATVDIGQDEASRTRAQTGPALLAQWLS